MTVMTLMSIGLMSGTSMDGIDAVLMRTDGTPLHLEVIADLFIPYDPAFRILLKAAEFAVRLARGDLEQAEKDYKTGLKTYLCTELNYADDCADVDAALSMLRLHCPLTLAAVIAHSTDLHLAAVHALLKTSGFAHAAIDVIGYHGQALFHAPRHHISVIVGDAKALAEQTGITVVSDFRRQDMVHGGQGAPFAPLYHQALAVRDHQLPIAFVNCGGIANMTVIRGEDPLGVMGFDTGPGNVLVDRLIRARTMGKDMMDWDGQYGLLGQIDQACLAALKKNFGYVRLKPPKSLDSGDMAFIPELEALSLEDAAATLEAFTAETIVESLMHVARPWPQRWVLCGGGWCNPVIVREFKARLSARYAVQDLQVEIVMADDVGWRSQSMEAEIFAYFAVRSLRNLPLSIPGTTGVSRAMSGGRVDFPLQGPSVSVATCLASVVEPH
jgi:anhydro-N-acetylmuramic acid kinase